MAASGVPSFKSRGSLLNQNKKSSAVVETEPNIHQSETHAASRVSTPHIKKKKKRVRSKHHHQNKHYKEIEVPNYDKVEGVVHIVLTEEQQRLLQCVVGENVTAEKPWTHIKKYYIAEQVESEEVPEDYQTFIPYKQAITEYPNDDFLIGYIPDESREYDEFYLCLNEIAEESVIKMVKEQEEQQQARLENTINKIVGKWTSMGSENDIEENWIVNTRGLYKVEFEAKYPIISPEVKFRYRLVKDVRDGYTELKVGQRYNTPILNKKRIDNATQVAPTIKEKSAQTPCGYPKNAWTQYEYHVDFIENLSKEWLANFTSFTSSHMDDLSDTLKVNGDINFYTNDYMDLLSTNVPIITDSVYQEYQSFDDVKRCMNKMISAMSWHPMWSGVVAIAYGSISPRWYHDGKKDGKMMERVVHAYNPILLWSFNDSLYPKLVLETNAEVHCLSFCPHDPNLLVGGCVNGQVVLWDIKNKLTKVETEEILTPAQQSYRTRLFGDMAWMQNTRDYSLVPPTAFTQLLFSHVNNITGIEWVHPLYQIERTGHIERIPEDETCSLQFITSSSDGIIKFWDLKQHPAQGDYKSVRRSRRLPKRPSALTMDVSPYRMLNRRMLPHFELDIVSKDSEKLCPIASISVPTDKLSYREVNPDLKKTVNITDRVIYEPINSEPDKPILPSITLGTYTGTFLTATWEGYEYISGDVFSKEDAKFLTYAKYHDGPVHTVQRHPGLHDVYLSIGGKIFCIWVGKLKEQPLFWRRSRNKYTHGNWERGRYSCFWFTTSDGSREYWNLDVKSDGPFSEHMYSGKPLLESSVHPLPVMNDEERVVGIADDRGTLRLILYNPPKGDDEEEKATFSKFLHNNADRVLDLQDWQVKWTDKHAGWIRKQAENELAEQARLREEQVTRQAFEEEQRAKEAVEEAKREAAKLHPPPGQYEQWAMERWILKEQERMGNELLFNKRLDKETLVKQQGPLKRLEVDAAKKQQKIKQRLSKVDEIFNDTIAMLFPILIEKPVVDLYEKVIHTDEEKIMLEKNFLNAFYDIELESNELVDLNPFVYELDWKSILLATKNKMLKDEFRYIDRHSERHRRLKFLREASIASNPTIRDSSIANYDEINGEESNDDDDDNYSLDF